MKKGLDYTYIGNIKGLPEKGVYVWVQHLRVPLLGEYVDVVFCRFSTFFRSDCGRRSWSVGLGILFNVMIKRNVISHFDPILGAEWFISTNNIVSVIHLYNIRRLTHAFPDSHLSKDRLE